MKISLKKDEFNPSFVSLYGEQRAIDEGYTVVEAPEDCAFEDFVDFKFVKQKYDNRKSKESMVIFLQDELNELYAWFESYDNQVKQYERCKRLNVEFDKDISSLDNTARINAERITEIRKILG